MSKRVLGLLLLVCSLAAESLSGAQPRRKVIVNEDASGPGGSNQQTLMLMLQSPEVEVLGITIASGDQWRDEEVAHTLRMLELIGRPDVPVYVGAAFPLVRSREETKLWERRYGRVSYEGAWDDRWWHPAFVVPPLKEGQPTMKSADENAVNFMIRMVHRYPHEVTIYEGAPMTNLALAISMDPEFADLAQELVFMGGSLNPDTNYPEFAENPRHEFNFWFDPEAAQIVLRAPWKKIVCTPTDVSIKARLTTEMIKEIGASDSPTAKYVKQYFLPGDGNDFMWDELAAAAWIDPSIITKSVTKYMSLDLDKGPGYGNTLTTDTNDPAHFAATPVEIQLDLDKDKFFRMFIDRMKAPTLAAAH